MTQNKFDSVYFRRRLNGLQPPPGNGKYRRGIVILSFVLFCFVYRYVQAYLQWLGIRVF
jgi:hypothetical protein